MDYNTQTPQMPPMSSNPMPNMPKPSDQGNAKMATIWLVVAVAVVAAIGWWWMSRSGMLPEPSPTPAAEDESLQELNELDADLNLDAEFQQIDQDLNSL